MELDDFLQPEVAVAAAVAAAIASPRGRKAIRRGLVYGTAGVLIAGDAIASFTRNISRSIPQMQAAEQASEAGQATHSNKRQRRIEVKGDGTEAK
ncbi:MAG: hypothetical protein IMW89_05300 [Ktedonobacteraceae bacterium]|nr:hypothetical protein [Ktedonobacteraceae bacterium]